jgi:hypothetical protein
VLSVAGRTGAVVLAQSDVAGLTTTSSPTFAGVTSTGAVSAPINSINRSGSVASGISWYSNTYTSWVDYMAIAGTAGQGPSGTLTPTAGTLVTSWGRRSLIENTAGYGWTFESGTSTTTSPTVVAEIRSSDGAAKFGGSVTGASFSGAGTGLTGTAASLSIGGNAATATTAGNVTGTVAIANGGTGATGAEAAATNLGVSRINPTTAKAGDIKATAGVISIYDGSAWKQVFPAVYA